ncbi:hypothetical protein F5144DRAFT_544439 [Chaetomium tenue]|uniref:Uncharacterized protein n=1 Tax=Chaetomium tenue TaxID=1854479 RepID=A0ACB7PGM6_9PEZI|nr:hypothetical protein F5144DRAFT_544439 [Chaetomium globosum]
MASTAHTITEALDTMKHAIPLPEYENPNGKQTASELGDTTRKYSAPAFAIELNVSVWTAIGHGVLQDIEQGNLTPRLDKQYINEKEVSMTDNNEADVVHAAEIHLLHPVHQALDLCPTVSQSVRVYSEVQRNKMRTDMSYHKIKGNNPGSTPMAVIEFKRRGILHHDKFMDGPVKNVRSGAANPPRPTNAEINAFKKEAFAANQSEMTLFEDNALKCMMQI